VSLQSLLIWATDILIPSITRIGLLEISLLLRKLEYLTLKIFPIGNKAAQGATTKQPGKNRI
jgi:hypothetical protein